MSSEALKLLEKVVLVLAGSLAGGIVGLGSSLVVMLLQWRHEKKVREEQWERENQIRKSERGQQWLEKEAADQRAKYGGSVKQGGTGTG